MRFNKSLGLVILGIVLGSLAVGVSRGSGQAPERPTSWEYSVQSSLDGDDKEFNELGKNGWELAVAFYRPTYTKPTYVFKRRCQN